MKAIQVVAAMAVLLSFAACDPEAFDNGVEVDPQAENTQTSPLSGAERFSLVRSYSVETATGFSVGCEPGDDDTPTVIVLNLENSRRFELRFSACGEHEYLGGDVYQVPYAELEQWLRILPTLPQIGWDSIGSRLEAVQCYGGCG